MRDVGQHPESLWQRAYAMLGAVSRWVSLPVRPIIVGYQPTASATGQHGVPSGGSSSQHPPQSVPDTRTSVQPAPQGRPLTCMVIPMPSGACTPPFLRPLFWNPDWDDILIRRPVSRVSPCHVQITPAAGGGWAWVVWFDGDTNPLDKEGVAPSLLAALKAIEEICRHVEPDTA